MSEIIAINGLIITNCKAILLHERKNGKFKLIFGKKHNGHGCDIGGFADI